MHENEVIYWRDLDGEGFVILDRLREHVPNATSLLMSADFLDRYSHLATSGNSGHAKELTNLSEDERRCYHQLCQANLRIEQEHIPQRHVVEALERQSVWASAPDYRS